MSKDWMGVPVYAVKGECPHGLTYLNNQSPTGSNTILEAEVPLWGGARLEEMGPLTSTVDTLWPAALCFCEAFPAMYPFLNCETK